MSGQTHPAHTARTVRAAGRDTVPRRAVHPRAGRVALLDLRSWHLGIVGVCFIRFHSAFLRSYAPWPKRQFRYFRPSREALPRLLLWLEGRSAGQAFAGGL